MGSEIKIQGASTQSSLFKLPFLTFCWLGWIILKHWLAKFVSTLLNGLIFAHVKMTVSSTFRSMVCSVGSTTC